MFFLKSIFFSLFFLMLFLGHSNAYSNELLKEFGIGQKKVFANYVCDNRRFGIVLINDDRGIIPFGIEYSLGAKRYAFPETSLKFFNNNQKNALWKKVFDFYYTVPVKDNTDGTPENENNGSIHRISFFFNVDDVYKYNPITVWEQMFVTDNKNLNNVIEKRKALIDKTLDNKISKPELTNGLLDYSAELEKFISKNSSSFLKTVDSEIKNCKNVK